MPAFSGIMPQRPMRRANREVAGRDELRAIVERSSILRVASRDAEGLFIVPLSFGFEVEGTADDPRWTFWVHTAREGRKVDAWRADPEVALELDVPGGVIVGDFACVYSYAYESVMASGRIQLVEDAVQKARGLRAIMSQMAPGVLVEFSDEAFERTAVWRIEVDRLTGKRREGAALEGSAPAPRSGADVGDDAEDARDLGPCPDDARGLGGKKKAQRLDGEKDPASGKGEKPAKLSKKERKRQIERLLMGERCPGCGKHCMLSDPSCGKGKKLQLKRLEQLGFKR